MNSTLNNLEKDRIDLPLSSKLLKAIDKAIAYELATNREDFITTAVKEKIANLGLYDTRFFAENPNFDLFANLAKEMLKKTKTPCKRKTSNYDLNDSKKVLKFIKRQFVVNDNEPIQISSFIELGIKKGLNKKEIEDTLKKLLTDGFLYQPKKDFIKRLL